MTLVCLFFLAIFKIVPKQGAKNGIQNRTIIKSGFSRCNLSPILIQLKGLIEFIQTSIFTLLGFGSVVYWLFPGNKMEGYCKENVSMRV